MENQLVKQLAKTEDAARFPASHLKYALDVLIFTLKVPRGSGQHLRLTKPGHLFRVARLLLFSSAISNTVRYLLLTS